MSRVMIDGYVRNEMQVDFELCNPVEKKAGMEPNNVVPLRASQ